VHRQRGADETSFLYGNPDNPFEVTATADAAGTRTTYFYDSDGALHAVERAG
jgi:YD repeat-containing protein